jgi:hypothetical protein
VRKFNDCDFELIETTEGIFLTTDGKANSLESSSLEIKENFHLLLADVDFKSFGILKIINKLNKKTGENMCNIIKSTMKLFQKHHDEFLTIYDAFGNQVVLYNNYGEIRVSMCERVSRIGVQTETSNCYHDIPIVMERKDRNVTAFLTSNGIIRKHSRTTDCSDKRIVVTPDNKWHLVKISNVTKIFNSSQDFASIQLLINNEYKTNWSHDLKHLDNLDLWNQFELLSQHIENKNIFLAHELAKPRQESVMVIEKAVSFSLMNQIKAFMVQVLIGLVVFATIVAIWVKRKSIWECIKLKPKQANTDSEHAETSIQMSSLLSRHEDEDELCRSSKSTEVKQHRIKINSPKSRTILKKGGGTCEESE